MNVKKIKGLLKICFERVEAYSFVLFAFSFLLLFLSGVCSAAETIPPISGSGTEKYARSLSQNNECEGPVQYQRLNQQLQRNVRNVRSGYRLNLQKDPVSTGFLHRENVLLTGRHEDLSHLPYEEVLTYRVYSRYALPVRAGPYSLFD